METSCWCSAEPFSWHGDHRLVTVTVFQFFMDRGVAMAFAQTFQYQGRYRQLNSADSTTVSSSFSDSGKVKRAITKTDLYAYFKAFRLIKLPIDPLAVFFSCGEIPRGRGYQAHRRGGQKHAYCSWPRHLPGLSWGRWWPRWYTISWLQDQWPRVRVLTLFQWVWAISSSGSSKSKSFAFIFLV